MRRHLFQISWRPTSIRPSRLGPSLRAESSQAHQASRIDRITSKLPRRLQKYPNGLRNAPMSHIVSFLILHELTAVVPLMGLFGLFHYTDYVPVSYMSEHFGSYVQEGIGRFERYFKRKEWFGFSKTDEETILKLEDHDTKEASTGVMDRWQSGEGKYKIVVEVALAYAITKALLPIRIVGSVWATPWFAGVMMKARGALSRKGA